MKDDLEQESKEHKLTFITGHILTQNDCLTEMCPSEVRIIGSIPIGFDDTTFLAQECKICGHRYINIPLKDTHLHIVEELGAPK